MRTKIPPSLPNVQNPVANEPFACVNQKKVGIIYKQAI